jgi:hypothetical protein
LHNRPEEIDANTFGRLKIAGLDYRKIEARKERLACV